MRIRFDFVTNSSSSSFVICRIDNKTLADLYIACGLYNQVSGQNLSVVREHLESEHTDMSGPGGGSISEWLEDAIGRDICAGEDEQYKKLLQLIMDHKNEIDYGTRSAEFATVVSITDNEGSYFSSEERKGGKIIYTGFDESDWDYKKEGEYIDDFIVGDSDNVRRKAKELCGTTVQEDPWFKKEDISDIFDPPDDFSFEDQVVCLTGDFDYGSKSKVTSFIENHGGTVSSSVTRKTSVVLMGNKGSDAWSHGNYGTKVEKAIERKNTRDDIIILKECKELFEG